MMRSLYSGVSGLKTHQTKMDVIGNNISNVNTVAFKSSSTQFQDIMYQTTSGASGATATTGGKNAKQIGLGVTTGATKVSIASSGAAQSTGEAFDIRLVDSNSTNFFIVSNGTQNLFTRAGSFYLDGNGNLAMTSTGYLVQGWQVDKETGEIQKDTVSALRLMQAENLISDPEWTTNGTFSGIIDENDVNVTSTSGYYRNFMFFDNLGYSYTAKFSIKIVNPDVNEYSVKLVNIYDEKGNDILNGNDEVQGLLQRDDDNDGEADVLLSDIFGEARTEVQLTDRNDNTTIDNQGKLVYKAVRSGTTITYTMADAVGSAPTEVQLRDGTTALGYTFEYVDPADSQTKQVGISLTELYNYDTSADPEGTVYEYDQTTGKLQSTKPVTSYALKFKTSDGSFERVTDVANTKAVKLNMSQFGDMFSDISIDFSQMKNLDNGGSSTVEVEKGDIDGTTGAGKMIGRMTSIAVSGDGRIFGSYSNGNTVLLGQIAVAQFANASGLESLGNNCYGTTLNSGEFDGMGVEVTADGGSMNSGQLEMSNVDLSTEFTEMITTQRGFQANSRIITVSDTLLEELTNLKR